MTTPTSPTAADPHSTIPPRHHRARDTAHRVTAALALLVATTPPAAAEPSVATSDPTVGTTRTAVGAAAAPRGAPPAGGTGWSPPVAGRVVRPADIPRSPWAPGHRGLDLAARPGDAVAAPAAGTVQFAGQVAGRGVVVVEHEGGLRSTLEPVTASAAVGTPVAAGDVLATLSTEPGHCTPQACLHWGVRLGAAYIDPASLLARPRIVLLAGRA